MFKKAIFIRTLRRFSTNIIQLFGIGLNLRMHCSEQLGKCSEMHLTDF